MSEMIERVARAMCYADGVDPDHLMGGYSGMAPMLVWQGREDAARAAIEAMHDPTVQMQQATILANRGDECPPIVIAREAYAAWICWRAMIDEALR